MTPEPSLKEILKAEAAALSSMEKAPGRVLLDANPRSEVWLTPDVEPPLNDTIELRVRNFWGKECIVRGWASRRFVNGSLTFWVRHGNRCRFIRPMGWRLAEASAT